jgi:hypothetical protein
LDQTIFWNANLAWWGAVGDCNITPAIPFGVPTINTVGTDNGPALANFGTWARYQSLTLGAPVVWEMPPYSNGGNAFGWNPNNCVNCMVGIKKLIYKGNRAYWQNTLTGSYQPWQTLSLPIRNASDTILSSLIATTNLQVYVTAASYNSASGVVTLTLKNGQQDLTTGSIFTVTGLTGTGVAPLNVSNAAAIAGSSGTNLEYQVATGLGSLTIATTNAYVQQGNNNTIVLINPAFAANINVGDPIMACSLDTNYTGYPPNPYKCRTSHGHRRNRTGYGRTHSGC